jgi:hypothetical protein
MQHKREANNVVEAFPAKRVETAEEKSFYQRNKTGLNILAFTAVAGAGFTSIYFTAGTTLPWVVSAAAKVGVDASFLTAWSVPAASGALTAIGTGALGVVYGVGSALSSLASFAWSKICGGSSAKEKATVSANEEVTGLTQQNTLNNALGVTTELTTARQTAEKDASPKANQVTTTVVLPTQERVEDEEDTADLTTTTTMGAGR